MGVIKLPSAEIPTKGSMISCSAKILDHSKWLIIRKIAVSVKRQNSHSNVVKRQNPVVALGIYKKYEHAFVIYGNVETSFEMKQR